MKREIALFSLVIVLISIPHTIMQDPEGIKDHSQSPNAIFSALPSTPLVSEEWFEIWTNNSGGDGDNLLFKITTNTSSTWLEVEVWNQTTSTLNQTSYVKKVSGEGGHEHCYAVVEYAIYTAFGTSHPYQWDRWFDLEGVSVGSTIGPIESAEGESMTLTVNTTDTITTPAGTFECWLANVSQFEMGFWFYMNYWIDKDSNVTIKATTQVPAYGVLLVDELVNASWLTPPFITDVSAEAQKCSAVVTWTTDEDADSTVRYGDSAVNLNMSTTVTEFVIDHSITLTNLKPLMTYYFEVESSDAWGSRSTNNNSGAFYTFTTLTAEAPEIVSLNVTTTSNITIKLVFDTDKTTNATVWYGLSQLLSMSVMDPVFSMHHELDITGLEEKTEYWYIIGVSDDIGNMANSSLHHITTLDQTAPYAGSLSASVKLDTLNVTVETNENCYAELYVGQNSTHLTLVDYRTLPQIQHSIIVVGLPSYSTVYFMMRLVDPSGNARWYLNSSTPFTKEVPDYLKPEVSHPDDIFLTEGSTFPNVAWIVYDQTPKSYEIIIDGVSQGVEIWDGMEITVILSEIGMSTGTYSVKLMLTDDFGNFEFDEVVVTIEAGSTQTLDEAQLLTLGVGMLIVLAIAIILYRRR